MTEIIEEPLSHRVVKGGFWVFALRITKQLFYLIRLIILARILAPHDFGLLGIAMLTMMTLETFSQTGFQAALIQKKENIDAYLNSAWTVGIIRGFILFIILYFIAPYVSIFFKTPQAELIIRVIGLSILIQAFTNIGVIYFQKELEFNKQFVYQLTGTLADFVVAVSAAFLLRSLGTTLNRLLELCETEYFARMDADDISLPQRLETQLKYLENKREVVLLGTQIAFLAGSKTCKASRTPLNHKSIDKVLMKGKIGLCHSSLMLRTDAAKKIGGYRIRGAGQDFDFFIRMGEIGRVANLGKVLHLYRMHLNSIVATKYYEVRRGTEFAIKCAKCRRNEKPEPSFESFAKEWENRSLIKRVQEMMDKWSGIQYRKAILEICNGKKVSGIPRLGIVAVCRPGSAFRQIKGQLYNRLHTHSLT